MVGPGLVDLVEGLALEETEAALAQALLGHHRDAGDLGNGLRRLVGTAQVTGVDRADLLACQGFADAAGLPTAGVVQADVELALDASIQVPGGLAVAHGDDAGGFHSFSL